MGPKMETKKRHTLTPRKPLTLYPLKFDEVMAAALQVKPAPKDQKPKAMKRQKKK